MLNKYKSEWLNISAFKNYKQEKPSTESPKLKTNGHKLLFLFWKSVNFELTGEKKRSNPVALEPFQSINITFSHIWLEGNHHS